MTPSARGSSCKRIIKQMSGLVQGRGGVLLGHQNTQELQLTRTSADLRNFFFPCNKHSFFFFLFVWLFCFVFKFCYFTFFLFFFFVDSGRFAKMTTAVVSPFFDFEVMNKVASQRLSLNVPLFFCLWAFCSTNC